MQLQSDSECVGDCWLGDVDERWWRRADNLGCASLAPYGQACRPALTVVGQPASAGSAPSSCVGLSRPQHLYVSVVASRRGATGRSEAVGERLAGC